MSEFVFLLFRVVHCSMKAFDEPLVLQVITTCICECGFEFSETVGTQYVVTLIGRRVHQHAAQSLAELLWRTDDDPHSGRRIKHMKICPRCQSEGRHPFVSDTHSKLVPGVDTRCVLICMKWLGASGWSWNPSIARGVSCSGFAVDV